MQCKIWRVLSARPRRRQTDFKLCWHSQHCQQTYGFTLVCQNWRFFVGNVGYLILIANIANKLSADGRAPGASRPHGHARDAKPTCVGIANIANVCQFAVS